MYIHSIQIDNLRTFSKTGIDFVYTGRVFDKSGLPKPRLPNVNLLLGDNGSGKTTLLKAIALAALGPAADGAGIFPHALVRNVNGRGVEESAEAAIRAEFTLHPQDLPADKVLDSELTTSHVRIRRQGEVEKIELPQEHGKVWKPIFSSKNDAFFFVGYGATRRVEPAENLDLGARQRSSLVRAQRVKGLFEESYSLIPLTYWLPRLKARNPGRYTQVVHLMNRVMGRGTYEFKGELGDGDYLYERSGVKVPFQALSDGYRAFLGWVGDLLYHVCFGCPSGKKLVDNRGIVMVDEIDLHLHPKWQMKVTPQLARAFPNLQFLLTSHSPLVAGSLEWMNVLCMKTGTRLTTSARRIEQSIHGLDADQLLLTSFFGLSTTRAATKERRLATLTRRAREGDKEAAKELLVAMSQGSEERG